MQDFELPPQNAASPFADMRGHHVAIRATSLEQAKDFYVGKLDFRVVAEWDYADERLAYSTLPASTTRWRSSGISASPSLRSHLSCQLSAESSPFSLTLSET